MSSFHEDKEKEVSKDFEGLFRQVHTPEQYSFDGGAGWRQQMAFGKEWKPSEMKGDMPQRARYTFPTKEEQNNGVFLNYTPYAPFSCAYGEANVFSQKDLDKLVDEVNAKYGKIFIFTAAGKAVKEAVKKRSDKVTVLCSMSTWMGKYDVWLCATRT